MLSVRAIRLKGYVRFGSKADICSAPTHVRFTLKATSIAFFGMSALGQWRAFPRRQVRAPPVELPWLF
jgi:hypothetical protein